MTNPHVSESEVERHFRDRVRSRLGGRALKFVSPGTAGVPDRLVLLPCGCARFVELKRPGERPRPLQVVTFTQFERLGHPVAVVHSKDAADEWIADAARHIGSCDLLLMR